MLQRIPTRSRKHSNCNQNWKFMCKSEIFFNLLGLTERETEVPKERILGDFRDMESTDARYVLVRLLSEAGLYPDQIAGMTNRTARGIRHLLARNITSPMIGIYLKQIRKHIRTGRSTECV